MNGAEFRRIMRARKISSRTLADAWGCHPQTIRNLWAKEAVPGLHQMALDGYLVRQALAEPPEVEAPKEKPKPPKSRIEERGVKFPFVPVVKSPTKIETEKEEARDPWDMLK